VAGDAAVCREAQELLGDVETVSVKTGLETLLAVCLLPDATGFDDLQIRERLSRSLSALAATAREPFPVTATMGAAVAGPMTPTDLDTLIRVADASLYARKQHRGEASVVLGPAADGQ
jgi:GGDEF domain-containing protein